MECGIMWITIDDKKVRSLWECDECGDQVYVGPDFYADNGEPFCANCEMNMSYVRTEIDSVE
jgi:formylmethanofuran dehydrogenase subunit E